MFNCNFVCHLHFVITIITKPIIGDLGSKEKTVKERRIQDVDLTVKSSLEQFSDDCRK